MAAIVDRIGQSVAVLNASSSLPFALSFSMGYAVYDNDSGLKAEEFLKQVDLLMYENKNRHKKSARIDTGS